MDEYVRYGEQWKKEMMRNKKEEIVRMFSDAMSEKEEYATEKCIEQKEIDITNCFKEVDTIHHDEIETAIRRAKLATDK